MNESARLAQTFTERYLQPRSAQILRETVRVRKAIVTVRVVNPGSVVGIADVTFADGTAGTLLYGGVTPTTAYFHRALAWGDGPYILDDACPILGSP